MRCRFQEIAGEVRDARGARRVKCERCGRLTKPSASPLDTFRFQCHGLPFAWEWGHWLTLWLGVFGISKAGINWLRRRLGMLGGCGCDKREATLNTIGERFAAMFRR